MLVAPIPYAFDSPMVEWVETLGKLEEFGAETIIPGHAGVQQDTEYIGQVISLLEATLTAVEKAKSEGVAYENLATSVDLSEHEQRFAGDDPARAYAWRSFFLNPGVKSAWASIGYPVPDSD
jgi:hypothetical protein